MATNRNKSVLDKQTVVSKGFPLKEQLQGSDERSKTLVGNCPTCGSPIYGQLIIKPEEIPSLSVFTCNCRTDKPFGQQIKTK